MPKHDELFDIQEAGVEILEKNGFQRYEISAFSREKPCKHNLNYWQFGDYLGAGASAHGKLSIDGKVFRTTKFRAPKEYLTKIDKTSSFEEIILEQISFEFMLNALRLIGGFDLALFAARTGLKQQDIMPKINQAVKKGWLKKTSSWVKPTTTGINFHNDLLDIFLP